MDAIQRRGEIMKVLLSKGEPISGNEIAELFGVTRQVIVQDIAILRAAGEEIIATSRGYLIEKSIKFYTKKIAVHHSEDSTEEELMIFIECGCRVIDVIVEHPIYGELHGMLMLNNTRDVKDFIKATHEKGAVLLSSLTQGVHLHTIEGLNKECIEKAEKTLRDKGMLLG